MKKQDAFNETILAYKTQGIRYLEGIEKLIPPQLYDFVKLITKGGKILDVGCAGGRDSKQFIDRGFEVVGVDVVDEFLKVAKTNVPAAEFLKMDLLELNFPNQTFDGIWSNAVLLHVQKKNISNVLKNYCRMLKPAGKLFLALKVGDGSASVTDKFTKDKRLFIYYQKEEIIKYIEEAKFKTIYCDISKSKTRAEGVSWIRLIAEKL